MISKLEKLILKYAKQYEGKPCTLSGGIDSGLLSALIKPKFAITVELPEGKHNEIAEAKKVAEHLGLKHIIVQLDESKFDEDMKIAVKAIGRPIPHFNIFPLFEMYKKLAEMGEKEIVLGDGPDETMCGYARDLIMDYLYKVYEFKAFKDYNSLIKRILPPIEIGIKEIFNNSDIDFSSMAETNIKYLRPDLDDMSDGIAKYFGITNLRPYQDNKELDDYMLNLPIEEKIYKTEYGKYALRKIAEKYLPKEIAWKKVKVGGPVFPVNTYKNWLEIDGEFGKNSYLKYQIDILND